MKIGRAILLTVFCLIVSVIFLKVEISENGAQNSIDEVTGIYGAYSGDNSGLDSKLNQPGDGPGWITGTELGVTGFLGETERGPAAPEALNDYVDYERLFGGYTGRSYMPYAVKGFFDNGGQRLYVARIISDTAKTASLKLKSGKKDALTISALNAGDWGNRIAVRVTVGKSSTETERTFRLEVFWFSHMNYIKVKTGKPDPSQADDLEVFDDISIQENSSYYFKNSVNGKSNLILISLEEEDARLLPDNGEKLFWGAGGSDGEVPVLSDYMGDDGLDGKPATGLNALGKIEGISTLYAPLSYVIEGLDKALIAQCETLQDRTAIFDTALGDPRPDPWSTHESSFAACYTPWISVTGFDSKDVMIPPGGYIAGIYARNDLVKGPNKAPVNEVLQGVKGVERVLSVQEQEALSIRKINPVITRTGTDYVAYGADSLSDMTGEYKRINQRRYVNYLFDTFSTRQNWVTGQKWSIELQKQIKISIEYFLDREWQRGALIGSNQIEAYYVKVAQQTVTQNGFEKQAIVMEIGVALQSPSEYFVFVITK